MVLDEIMSSNELNKTSTNIVDLNRRIDVEKLRNKFKWMKDQWHSYTDRGKKGRDQSPLKEPERYKLLNPIFSDTHANMELAS